MLKITILLLWSAVLLTGCGYLQRHQAPNIANIPDHFLSTSTAAFVDDPWWPAFQDTTLSRLIEEALTSSPTMEIALARMDQLQAAKRYATSSQFPSISVSGAGLSGDQRLVERYNDAFRAYSVRANTVYELDFWKKLSSERRSAISEVIASQYDANASMLALTSQVARNYYTTVRLRQELKVLRKTEASYVLDSIAVRSRLSLKPMVSSDGFQAQTVLAQTRALINLISASLGTEEHALSILLGHYPLIPQSASLDSLPSALEAIGAGVPSELIERRPDIQAIRARLAAADYSWAAAYAERFPSLILSGSSGNVSHDLGDALNPSKMTFGLVTGLTLPLFEGGRLKAQSEGAGAVFREVSAQYVVTVLNAFREVEDALTLGDYEVEAIHQLEIAEAATDSTLHITNEQYQQGAASHLAVFVAQGAQLDAARNLISARFDLITYRIDLATALGGSWSEQAIDKAFHLLHPTKIRKKK
jgi:outer membrane protein, multidrug efflux system